VGQFKDGLDMSAIREVKFLRELSHPNVIQVRPYSPSPALPILPTENPSGPPELARRCILKQIKLEPRPRIPRNRLGSRYKRQEFSLPTE